MGCLSFIVDLIFESILEGWFLLMQLIIPRRLRGRGLRRVLKAVVGIFSGLLLASIFFGIFALISEDPEVRQIGEYMVFIPLILSAVQIAIGIIVRLFTRR